MTLKSLYCRAYISWASYGFVRGALNHTVISTFSIGTAALFSAPARTFRDAPRLNSFGSCNRTGSLFYR